MDERHALQLMNEAGAIITDSHCVFTSGRHGDTYLNKDAIYPHTWSTSQLCYGIAEHFKERGVEAVIAPAVGGVILSQWVTHHLDQDACEQGKDEILALYADRDGDGFVIKRGYEVLIPGRNVLIVEDVLNTAGTVKKVVTAVKELKGNVVGVGALCNRGGVTAEVLGVPELYALVTLELKTYLAEACPLCQKGVPINTSVGKGREFLMQQ